MPEIETLVDKISASVRSIRQFLPISVNFSPDLDGSERWGKKN
jgi:hypothetical protein